MELLCSWGRQAVTQHGRGKTTLYTDKKMNIALYLFVLSLVPSCLPPTACVHEYIKTYRYILVIIIYVCYLHKGIIYLVYFKT